MIRCERVLRILEGDVDRHITDARELIRDTARRVPRDQAAPRAAEMDEASEHLHDVSTAFRHVGLLKLSLPQLCRSSGTANPSQYPTQGLSRIAIGLTWYERTTQIQKLVFRRKSLGGSTS